MKRFFSSFVISLQAIFFISGCAVPARTSFTYQMPSFNIALQGVNFEYVRYGVKAEVRSQMIRSRMLESQSIGLINKALGQIHEQVPTAQVQSGQYALVNVVTDIYNVDVTAVTDYGQYGKTAEAVARGIDVLSIRADVIKILPSQGNADAVGLAPSRGFYPWTEAGKELLVRDLIPALQNLSLSTSNSDIEIASYQKQFD